MSKSRDLAKLISGSGGTLTGDINFTGNIIPTGNNVYNLGTSTLRWKDLVISGQTIDLGGAKISQDAGSGTIALVAAPTESNPSPKALVVTSTGGTVAVNTTGGNVNFDVVANTVANTTAFDGSIFNLTEVESIGGNSAANATDGTVLKWSSSNSTFYFASAGGGTLASLTDVAQVTPSDGQILKYSSANTTYYFADSTGFETGSAVATANGTATQFTSPVSTSDVNNILVTVDGVLQRPTTDYTVSGTTVTFDSAPPSGTIIMVRSAAVSSPVPTSTTLASLTDVAQSTPSDGQILKYSSANTTYYFDDASAGGVTTGKAIVMAIVFG